MDELTLYRRDVFEALRGPLEDGVVRIARPEQSRDPDAYGRQVGPRRRLSTSLLPRIAGLPEHNGATYPATWPAIIPEEQHLQLRARFSATGKAYGRRYLLAGLARCGLCTAPLIARPKADGRRCYVCASDTGGCGKIRQLAAPLEELVARETNRRDEERGPTSPDDDADALARELKATEDALEDLARARFVLRNITEK